MRLQKLFFGVSVLCSALILLSSCAPIRHVRPVDKGAIVATASVGGPFTGQIGWIPFPLLSVGANYGLADKIDIEAGFEGTSALFGVLELDRRSGTRAISTRSRHSAMGARQPRFRPSWEGLRRLSGERSEYP